MLKTIVRKSPLLTKEQKSDIVNYMLTIKNKHNLKQNYYIDRSKNAARMQFSESNLGTEDEMARAIVTDDETYDNNWILDEYPDGEKLAAFWAKVRDEARQDPNWNSADEAED